MKTLKELYQEINYDEISFKAYKFLEQVYNWKPLTESEYHDAESLAELKYPRLATQILDLEEGKIKETTYDCCYGYNEIVFNGNEIKSYGKRIIKPSMGGGCNCGKDETRVEEFESMPYQSILDPITDKCIAEGFEKVSEYKIIKKNKETKEVIDELNLINSIGDLPTSLFEKLPSDFVDLITEEKIELIGYSTLNSPYVKYRINTL